MSAHPARITNVYVHAPFCARRCCYCDFAVEVNRNPVGAPWLAAIGGELDALGESGEAPLAPTLDTLYVGGGTPSLLEPRFVAGLAGVIEPHRLSNAALEWTAEANPESFSERVADVWAAAGVNRISLGVQSFDQAALRWMGRLHCAADVGAAVERGRAAGVPNLSVDLIFGLPDSVPRSWEEDVTRALELEVPHISLYGLTVEKETPLHRAVSEGRARMPTGARYREEYLYAAETVSQAGYRHYEVSNFAQPGFACRHNIACWERRAYLGVGLSAHSFFNDRRTWNIRPLMAYIGSVESSGVAIEGEEVISSRERRVEQVMLGLRRADGIPEGLLGAGRDWTSFIPDHLLERGDGRVRLTRRGLLLADLVCAKLVGETEWKSA